ncbi:hypothetical protein AAZX31_12G187400 [Glycine max]|uniref:B box-type domain-containing protein n=2 Tax=Glycine subgen. Soja TaxID=1462606 RepID=I1LUA3_SOYBN|nr:zinc finger protein CONSTANS-LIKE 3 [Glycine max]XP_028192873.1 zinc finger protein CONSTANS-LIKE 3-like [Glycine soja]KAG4986817.1 hypothetical protein JHK86_034508 [Glycine max]KAG5120017.1 hypothetical protein JHK82_034437 [Glycine max]KAG5141002.1 hypothetical protein JHK84_034770 [Glycine max]KAH1144054.1 hypothetical protein GYH30_034320 [Glycine max]KAH1222518.1 B-box domain protein 31 [Glycine max]|eukprot:XP_003540329.1 zinc finger protein CONSTANS-LIKE 3 [Glycine max]
MKNCELCKLPARTFCESDQASLCWDCDAKVHGANFLVARHTRTLLCHACQSLTPWKASGSALGNTVSLCQSCAGGTTEQGPESQGGNDDDDIDTDDEDDYDDDGESEENEVAADEEDGDNQVVPWSSEPPPPSPSSSSSEESISRCNNVDEVSTTLKRRRENDDFQGSNSNNWKCERSEVDRGCWLARLRRRTADDVAVERRRARAAFPYGCCDDRASEDV